jgi:hypothetical protein
MADAESWLQQRLDRARAAAHDDIPVAGLGGDVVVRYQPLSRDTIDELQQRYEGRMLEFNPSLIIRACVAILARGDDGRLVSIDPDDTATYVDDNGELHGTPLTYASERTWDLLGVSHGDGATRNAAVTLHAAAEGAIDQEANTVIRLSGYGQDGDASPESKRSRATR